MANSWHHSWHPNRMANWDTRLQCETMNKIMRKKHWALSYQLCIEHVEFSNAVLLCVCVWLMLNNHSKHETQNTKLFLFHFVVYLFVLIHWMAGCGWRRKKKPSPGSSCFHQTDGMRKCMTEKMNVDRIESRKQKTYCCQRQTRMIMLSQNRVLFGMKQKQWHYHGTDFESKNSK